jgi:uncharacterized membrane-anchored protein YhcB (DUF1043 family)
VASPLDSSFWSDPVALLLAAAVLVGAFLLGLAFGRRRAQDAVDRARDLEDRLQIAEEEMSRYRQEVADHFAQTSKLLRDLTLQYRNVYEHLAEGARTLCPEAGTLLPGSLAEAALPAEASEPEQSPRTNGAARAEDDAQLDLLEHTDAWQSAPARSASDDLEPLLDEEVDERLTDLGAPPAGEPLRADAAQPVAQAEARDALASSGDSAPAGGADAPGEASHAELASADAQHASGASAEHRPEHAEA